MNFTRCFAIFILEADWCCLSGTVSILTSTVWEGLGKNYGMREMSWETHSVGLQDALRRETAIVRGLG